MNTNRDIKRYWTPENTTEEKQTRGVILNTDEVLFNVDDLEDRISEIENFLRTAFDGSVLKEAFGGTENSQWVDFIEDLSVKLDNAVLTQNDDNSYLFVGNENNSGKFNFSSLWNWIVSKLSSVFGLVKNNETEKVTLSADITGDVTGNVTGNADTATLANRAEKVDISTSSSNANFLLASIDNDAIINGETPKRTSLKFNETTKELSSGDKVFASLEDVNSITAKYITSSVDGAAFADEAALQGILYYAGQVISTQTTPALGDNDYCIVLDSGFNHDHSTARYVYQNGVWTFQYKVSQITLTQSQLDALNSGITAAKVTKLDNLEEGYAFTYIVDSDVKLANWLNGVPGNDYSSVLVKTGTWNYNGIPLPLDDNSINTKKIIGEYNSVIHISADGDNDDVVGLKNGEYIYNIILSVSNTGTSSAMETYGFVSCDNLTNCSVVIDVNEVNSRVYGYYRCHKLLDCNANTTGVLSVCFDECEELNRCEANADTYETIQGATGSMCFSLCRRLNYCKATANRGSSSPAAIGYYMCYGVTYCKAQSDDRLYQSSYSSLGAVDGYECSNSLNGGFNSNINDTITGFLSPLGQVYAECSTSASTNTKQITATINSSLILVKGLKITVAFTNSNSASAPAISIDGGSTSIRIADEYGNLPASGEAVNLWLSGEIVDFIYDGTYWRIMRKDHNPVGTIIAHANSNAPAGYILCDGRQLATSQYPQLSAACGSTYNTYSGGTPSSGYFRIPDLRETTLVGAGTRGSRVTRHLASSTSGMSAGVFYDDALQGHSHSVQTYNTSLRDRSGSYYVPSSASASGTNTISSDGSNGTPRIDYTTHGKIMAIYYYIKYF